MFKISSNGIVTVNRGDSFNLPIVLQFVNHLQYVNYEMQDTDVIYLGIMEPNQPFETALIRKKFTYNDLDDDGKIYFKFRPEDTVCLLPGKYYYQVKLQSINAETGKFDVETIIDKTLFYIQE